MTNLFKSFKAKAKAFGITSIFTIFFAFPLHAQVKVGSNPTTINTNTNLEVEATDATRLRVNKDNGNVGIGTTAAPTNKLQVRATADPLKLEGVQTGAASDQLLVIDANGIVKKTPSSSVVGLLTATSSVLGTTRVSIPAGTTSDLPGATVTITPMVNVRVVITTSALPLPAAGAAPVQGSIDLLQNGIKIASQYYSATDAPTFLGRLGNYSTISRVVDLTPGTYIFKLQAKSWANTTLFNVDPVAGGYVGASGVDDDAMKASIIVMSYTR
jgi:hypothetical protein